MALPFLGMAQSTSPDDTSLEFRLNQYIHDDFDAKTLALKGEYLAHLDRVISKLRIKQTQYKSELSFLRYMFYNVHRKMLGRYDQYALFSDLFAKNGAYDCVTGSILYAMIFEELGIQYKVRETDYHVYLLAFAGEQEIMIETTDPFYGFVIDKEEIRARKDLYSGKMPDVSNGDKMTGLSSEDPEYQNVDHVDNEVSIDQLPALLYYNQAIKQFNAGEIQQANVLIKKAQAIFPTPRINNTASYMFSIAFED